MSCIISNHPASPLTGVLTAIGRHCYPALQIHIGPDEPPQNPPNISQPLRQPAIKGCRPATVLPQPDARRQPVTRTVLAGPGIDCEPV